MASIIVGDLETDGLLEECTTIWCGSFLNMDTNEVLSFTPDDGPNYQQALANYLDYGLADGYYFVCHNAVQFDVPVIRKLQPQVQFPSHQIIDTLVLSRMMFPDIKGHKAPHSLEAWGQRFGVEKPKHEDWTQYSPEMLHRNVEDVKINTLLIQHMIKKGFEVQIQ